MRAAHMCTRGVRARRSGITLVVDAGSCGVAGRDHSRARRVVRLDKRRRVIRTTHCMRCKRRVPLRRPWGGWRYVRLLWFATLVASLPILPALAFDACFMLPAFMLFLTAIGPLNELARRRPACARCGLAAGGGPPTGASAPVLALRRRRRGRSGILP
jgi:hypothetical protein